VSVHNVKSMLSKLQELQGAVGLSDDEVAIMVATSLDHDYLPHLLGLAGEFLKWFNLDF